MTDSIDVRPIRRSINSIEIAHQLMELIKRGEIKAGEKLPSENKLANDFKVSRSCVRETLRSLEMMDIIETQAGRGSFVKKMDVSSAFRVNPIPIDINEKILNELLEVRIILETEVAVIVARDAEDFTDLEELIEQMEVNYAKGEDIAELALMFHEKLVALTGNTILREIYKLLASLLREYHEKAWSIFGKKEDIDLHKKLLEDLKKREPDIARKGMEKHLKNTQEILIKKMKLLMKGD